MKTAAATIKGFEIMRMIKRRHCLLCKRKVPGEIQFINKLFGVAALIRKITKWQPALSLLMQQSLKSQPKVLDKVKGAFADNE